MPEYRRNYHFVNLFQTNEERQAKYWLCRSLGANSYLAHRMRDWPLRKIERYYGIAQKIVLQMMPDGRIQSTMPDI